MALPSSGSITMAMIATELGISPTGLSLNDSRVRTLAGVPSGAISMANLYGKSNIPTSWTGTFMTNGDATGVSFAYANSQTQCEFKVWKVGNDIMVSSGYDINQSYKVAEGPWQVAMRYVRNEGNSATPWKFDNLSEGVTTLIDGYHRGVASLFPTEPSVNIRVFQAVFSAPGQTTRTYQFRLESART